MLLWGLTRLLGWRWGRALGQRLGSLAFRLLKRERQTTLDNLALAFPELPQVERLELGRRVFEHFGRAAAEVVNLRRLRSIHDFVELDFRGRQVLEEKLGLGRGVIFVTAHLGNWELMARKLAASGYPVNTIGRAAYDPRLTRLIEKFRLQGGVHTIWRGEEKIIERMLEVLRRGEILGLLIDQDTRVPGEFAPFFGHEAFTPSAPVTLAIKSGAELVVGFNYRRHPDGYLVVVESFQLDTSGPQDKVVAANLTRLNRLIEEQVRQHPVEWVWMHRRWKTRPQKTC